MKQADSYQYLKKMLNAAALKATPQRILILEALYHLKNHPTAEGVYEKIHRDHPSISLATVYKTLDSLVQANLVVKVFSDEGNYRFDCNTDYHNHIYCSNTQEIIDYEDPDLQKLLEEYFWKKEVTNLKIKDIRLQIHAEKIDPDKDITIK